MRVLFPLLALLLLPVTVRGDGVALVPACIVLDAGTDSATVILENHGTTAVAWRVDLVRMGCAANGALRPLAPGDAGAARIDGALEVTPRSCTLAPGESRTIRLRLRQPLPAGIAEWRSHLVVHEASSLAGAGDPGAFGAGAAIPLVLRSGPPATRWRDEQFRAGSTRGAPAIVILDLAPARSTASS